MVAANAAALLSRGNDWNDHTPSLHPRCGTVVDAREPRTPPDPDVLIDNATINSFDLAIVYGWAHRVDQSSREHGTP